MNKTFKSIEEIKEAFTAPSIGRREAFLWGLLLGVFLGFAIAIL